MQRVMIDLDGRCVCPVHGPVEGEYEPGRAACGCQWVALAHGRLGVGVPSAGSKKSYAKDFHADLQDKAHIVQDVLQSPDCAEVADSCNLRR